jgi:threonine dehydratase
MSAIHLDAIRAARARISGQLHLTPVVTSTMLATQSGVARFALKCESMQKTGSFKVSGALNAVMLLDEAARARGVVTVSAGNHAQALAWAARSVGVRCTVVMPATASESKAAASAGYGATVIRHGTAAEAFAHADALAQQHGFALVHPFDNADVIAGAGVAGLVTMEQAPDTEAIVVPIGGGGLLAGIASAVKPLHPKVKVFGVEPEGAAAMRKSLDAGHPVRLERIDTIADGLAAPFAGELTYPIIRDLVDDVVLVSDTEIAGAMSLLLSRTKLLAEPAGATAAAAVLAGKLPLAGLRVVMLLSGGNVDLERLKTLI